MTIYINRRQVDNSVLNSEAQSSRPKPIIQKRDYSIDEDMNEALNETGDSIKKHSGLDLNFIMDHSDSYMTDLSAKSINQEIAVYENRVWDNILDPDDDLTENECKKYHNGQAIRNTRYNKNNSCYHNNSFDHINYKHYENETRIFFNQKKWGENTAHYVYVMGQRMIRNGRALNTNITFIDGSFITDSNGDKDDEVGFNKIMEIIEGYNLKNKLIIIPKTVSLNNKANIATLMALLSSKHPIAIIIAVDDINKWVNFLDDNGNFDIPKEEPTDFSNNNILY